MKKIFTLLFSFLILGIIFPNILLAQAGNINTSADNIISTVSINKAKIISQSDRDFVISFNLSNGVGVQPQLKYSIELVKVTNAGQSVLDEKVYEDTISLDENSAINKTINYSIPSSVSMGNYRLYIQSKNTNGLTLAISSLGDVKVVTDISNIIQIIPGSCTYTSVTKQTTTSQDIPTNVSSTTSTSSIKVNTVIAQKDVYSIKCKVRSTFPNDVTVLPQIITREHSSFGPVISFSDNNTKENLTIINGVNDIVTEVSKATKPQNYNISLSLVSTDGKIVSNTVSYYYYIAGASGDIQSAIFDKTNYKAGDIAKLKIFSTQTGTSTIAAKISDSNGTSCANIYNQDVSGFSVANLLIPIIKDCSNPQAKIELSSGSTTLDIKNFQVVLQANANIPTKKAIIPGLTILLILVPTVGE